MVRPGGPVFAAAISRWAPRLDGIMLERLDETYPDMPELVVDVERTGQLPPLGPGSFSGFCHRPRQLYAELRAAGLTVADLVSIEGPAFLLADLAERLEDPAARAVVLDTARAVERVPELLGIGPHLLATGIRPRDAGAGVSRGAQHRREGRAEGGGTPGPAVSGSRGWARRHRLRTVAAAGAGRWRPG